MLGLGRPTHKNRTLRPILQESSTDVAIIIFLYKEIIFALEISKDCVVNVV